MSGPAEDHDERQGVDAGYESYGREDGVFMQNLEEPAPSSRGGPGRHRPSLGPPLRTLVSQEPEDDPAEEFAGAPSDWVHTGLAQTLTGQSITPP